MTCRTCALLAYPKVVDLLSSLWCCRSGAGTSRWLEKAVLVSSLDEDDGEEVFPMDMSAIPKGRFHWVPTEFSKVALSRHFGQAQDSPSSFFHTSDLFR